MKQTSIILAIATILSLGFGCASNNTKQTDGEKITSPLEELEETVGSKTSNTHTVLEISSMLALSGADFMPSIMNDVQSVKTYGDNKYIAAANMGVYFTDVLYQAAYEKSEGAMYSYNAAKGIANFIGLGTVYDEIALNIIEDGITKEDSILHKLNGALTQSKNNLTETEQAYIFNAIVLGGNIQRLYILNEIIFNYPVELPADAKLSILRGVIISLDKQIKQQVAIAEFLSLKNAQTKEGKNIMTLAKELSEIYATVSLPEEVETIKEENIFGNEKLIAAHAKIKELRAAIVK